MATVISSGTRTVSSGQSLVDVDVLKSGAVVVSKGGKVTDAYITSGGKAIVSSGGSVSAARVYSAGSIYVQMGGVVNEANLFGSGYVSAAGGRVYSATIGQGGSLDVFGWTSDITTVYGNASDVTIVSGGLLALGYSATGSDVKVSSGFVYVSSGGFLQESIIGSGGGSSKSAHVYIKAGGSGRLNHIYSNGIMVVSSGASAASNKVYSGGSILTSGGGLIDATSVFGGTVDVLPGAKASNTRIESNGGFYVSSGASCYATTVTSGRMYLMSGATAYGTTLEAGRLTIYGQSYSGTIRGGTAYLSGGSSYHERMTGGVMEVSSYGGSRGYANDLVIQSATAYLNSDTSLNVGLVGAGGKLYVYEGARASSVDVKTSGEVFVKSGGYISGGSIYGSETIMSGGSAHGVEVLLLGTLDVRGKAYNCTVASGGTVFISSGAGFTADFLSAGARISAMSGATATVFQAAGGSAVVSGGSVYVSGGSLSYADLNGGQLHISSGAKLMDALISAGTLAIQSGGSGVSAIVFAKSALANLTINPGGFLSSARLAGNSARLNIGSGATVNNADVMSGANATISGRVDSCCFYDGASGIISSGGSANDVIVTNEAAVTIRNAGKAYDVSVSFDGSLIVSSGGTSIETDVGSKGVMTISSGGSAISGTTVRDGGWLRIASSGYADSITLRFQGGMQMEGGTVMNLYVSRDCRAIVSGGSIVSATLNDGSALCYKGKLGGTVSSGGIAVFSGGTATDINVVSGGKVKIADNLTMLAGDSIAFNAGGILDFDISGINASGYAALLNGYNDHISNGGNAVYTLTVGDSQKDITYLLANNASSFNSTISVQNASGTSLGTLSLGNKVKIGSKDYTLNLDGNSVLSVTVEAAAPSGSARGDRDGNGVSDVMFVWTGNTYAHGYWMNGSADWWSANAIGVDPAWDNLGSYDMSGDGKADAVMFGNVTTEAGIKGAYIGYYQDGDDANGWVTIGFLDNAENVAWQNKVGNLTGNASGANSIVWYAPERYALGAWIEGTDTWVGISEDFGGEAWNLAGCGDFDGDGKDAILMSYNASQYYTVDLDGTVQSMGASAWYNCAVRAIGDFSGDGREDIVLFDENTGSMYMLIDGNADNYQVIGQLDPTDWFVAGCGDYNNDQHDDLLVRQNSTGMLGYYSDAVQANWNVMGYGVGMEWTVIA